MKRSLNFCSKLIDSVAVMGQTSLSSLCHGAAVIINISTRGFIVPPECCRGFAGAADREGATSAPALPAPLGCFSPRLFPLRISFSLFGPFPSSAGLSPRQPLSLERLFPLVSRARPNFFIQLPSKAQSPAKTRRKGWASGYVSQYAGVRQVMFFPARFGGNDEICGHPPALSRAGRSLGPVT